MSTTKSLKVGDRIYYNHIGTDCTDTGTIRSIEVLDGETAYMVNWDDNPDSDYYTADQLTPIA
jgi:DNA polymerase elongation subunit (family B)